MPASVMRDKAAEAGLKGDVYDSVPEAYRAALHDSSDDDFVFIGGSSFVVADLLAFLGANIKN